MTFQGVYVRLEFQTSIVVDTKYLTVEIDVVCFFHDVCY